MLRRGAWCLAAARGEHGQEKRDKEKSGNCARDSMTAGRGLWRGVASDGSRSARKEVVD
jgi:hypothetical protein